MRILILTGLLTAAGIAAWAGFTLVQNQPIHGFVVGLALFLATQVITIRFPRYKKQTGDNQRMVQEAERGRRLAIYHPATGLLAQWYFELRVDEETTRAKRYGPPLVVLTLEGSQAEEVGESNPFGSGTNETSRIVTGAVRSTDLVGTIGYTGLAICLVHCDRAGAIPVIRRMMAALGEGDWRLGIAVYPDDDVAGKDLIAVAAQRSAPWRASSSSIKKTA